MANMASQLTTPDMSALPTLLPGRETTTNVPAGQRVLVAVPDPSRTSLVISSSGTGPLTLSTIASGGMSEGMQFPSGLASPYIITWDLYGSKSQDAWYAGNPGATDISVTVIEVMSRPKVEVTSTSKRVSRTPLADCLKRRPLPVFSPPALPIPIGGGGSPGSDCLGAGTLTPGVAVNVDNAPPVVQNQWWTFQGTAGLWHIEVHSTLATDAAELFNVFTGDCDSLVGVFQASLADFNSTPRQTFILPAGPAKVKVFLTDVEYHGTMEIGPGG